MMETHLLGSHEQHKAGSQAVPMPHNRHLLWSMQNLKWRSFVFLESFLTFLQMAGCRLQPGSAQVELIFRSHVFIICRIRLISILGTMVPRMMLYLSISCLYHKPSKWDRRTMSSDHTWRTDCVPRSAANLDGCTESCRFLNYQQCLSPLPQVDSGNLAQYTYHLDHTCDKWSCPKSASCHTWRKDCVRHSEAIWSQVVYYQVLDDNNPVRHISQLAWSQFRHISNTVRNPMWSSSHTPCRHCVDRRRESDLLSPWTLWSSVDCNQDGHICQTCEFACGDLELCHDWARSRTRWGSVHAICSK